MHVDRVPHKAANGKVYYPDHPDRNEQFLYINNQVKKFLDADQPVISIDTKKKENLGNFSNKGREYRPKKSPRKTNMHDFPDKKLGKAIPYSSNSVLKSMSEPIVLRRKCFSWMLVEAMVIGYGYGRWPCESYPTS